MSYEYLFIDGNHMAWRSASVMFLSNEQGENVTVAYGMLNMVRSLIEDYQPKSVCVCWDAGGSKAKREFYPDYKKDREVSHFPEQFTRDISIQIQKLQSVLQCFGIYQLSRSGVEADDIIGLLCSQYGNGSLVVSGDKGIFQVVQYGASIYFPNKNIVINKNNFTEVVGVDLDYYTYYLSLVGHKGGGIPGISGIGPVTAKKLLTKYGPWTDWFVGGRIRIGVLEDMNKKQQEIMLSDILPVLNRNYKLALLGGLVEDIKDGLVAELHSQKPVLDEDAIKKFFTENQFVKYLASFRGWIHPFRRLVK